MKRILTALTLVVVLACNAGAGVILKDSIIAADTVAAVQYADTVYTASKTLRGLEAGTVLQFHTTINQLIGPTSYANTGSGNLTDDSILVSVQHSFNGVDWTTVPIDTFFGTHVDTQANSTIIPDLSAVVYGPYVRGMFIHVDDVEADIPDSLANVYYWECELYIQTRN